MNESKEISVNIAKDELKSYAVSLAKKIVTHASVLPSSLDGTTVECRVDTDVFIKELENNERKKEMSLEDVAILTSLTHDEVDKQLRMRAQVVASETGSKYKWAWFILLVLATIIIYIIRR